MDILEYKNTMKRMCNFYIKVAEENTTCTGCPLNGMMCDFLSCTTQEQIDIVEQWEKEHPIKTRQTELLKMFPNIKLYNNYIAIAPCNVDKKHKCILNERGEYECGKCRKKYWSEEVE